MQTMMANNMYIPLPSAKISQDENILLLVKVHVHVLSNGSKAKLEIGL